jgi:hypothetical protein
MLIKKIKKIIINLSSVGEDSLEASAPDDENHGARQPLEVSSEEDDSDSDSQVSDPGSASGAEATEAATAQDEVQPVPVRSIATLPPLTPTHAHD